MIFFSGQGGYARYVHEQLGFQLLKIGGLGREAMLTASWFFFELMIKAMVEHLATNSRQLLLLTGWARLT